MLAAEITAAAINRRISAEVKTALAQHSGRVVALALPGRRLVFAITANGELRAASPLIKADAEIAPFAENSDNPRVEGDAELLKVLSAVWLECADVESGLAEILGEPLAADIFAIGKTIATECKTAIRQNFAADEEEIKTFKSRIRTFTTGGNKP